MKILLLSLCLFVSTSVFADPQNDTQSNIIYTPDSDDGYTMGITAAKKISFYGATPIIQPTDASQAALVDLTSGTSTNNVGAGVGIQYLSFPLSLVGVADGDVITAFTPGFDFEIISMHYVSDVPASTANKGSVFNVEVGSTDLTGGVLTLTTTNLLTGGVVVDATAITAGSTGLATSTISIEAATTTTFGEGSGSIQLKVRNVNEEDFAATMADKWNEFRSALVALGLVAGS